MDGWWLNRFREAVRMETFNCWPCRIRDCVWLNEKPVTETRCKSCSRSGKQITPLQSILQRFVIVSSSGQFFQVQILKKLNWNVPIRQFSSFRAVSEQFQSSFRAVSEQFQSSFRAVLEQFQSSFCNWLTNRTSFCQNLSAFWFF